MGKNNMLRNINKMLRVLLDDGREVKGKLLVYDKHMNVVLGDAIETRVQTKKMKEAGVEPTRKLGLILLRGEHVVSVTVEKDHSASSAEADYSRAPKASNTSSKPAAKKRVREE